MERKEAADMVLVVNTTFSARKVLSHVLLQQLVYNEKNNLSRLLRVAVSSSMKIPALKEAIIMTARIMKPAIIQVTGDQKWH